MVAEMVAAGVVVGFAVGVEAEETTTLWVPAVALLNAQTTVTVKVPGLTFDQAADCRAAVPESAA
ncbi:hypothetical protein GCM10010276_06740 [Streptomyces longisporus]|uniref:Uncharacterized protein n=1 Tax=Streptomyces longisporus TaxID=1948 RepID=A0ABP5Y5M0_STRLO